MNSGGNGWRRDSKDGEEDEGGGGEITGDVVKA